MFEDVAQMEKEIDDFRKNMAASSELVKGIEQLTETVRQQQNAFAASADGLLHKMDSGIAQTNADHQATLKKLGKRVDDAIAELRKNEAAELETKVATIERVCGSVATMQEKYTRDCERLLAEMKKEMSDRQADLDIRLQGTEQMICAYQTDIEQKYNDFISKLEAVDVDRMYREIQEMKKDMRLRSAIGLGLLGIAAIAAVIGLFIR